MKQGYQQLQLFRDKNNNNSFETDRQFNISVCITLRIVTSVFFVEKFTQ